MTKWLALPVVAFALVACEQGAVVTHDPTGQLGVCPAPAFQDFVGQPYANTLFEWPDLRIIRPGDRVTRDYLQNRLNVDLDENEVITRIWCG
ncbi:MAG: I78 family peptidase inhibitor [Pseudomonadota bacterium]|nr:I78 family peptidase inhibitor [Pseudomonadota bacterium]